MTPKAPANRLSSFFNDAEIQFGVFYPKHYLLAVFPNFADAERVKMELNGSGRLPENVISVPGEEVVRFAEDHLLKDGLWGAMMTELSRAFGTEAVYADRDLASAREGAAFVAVHCPTDDAKNEAWHLLEPTHPLVARYYSLGGIEHFVGES